MKYLGGGGGVGGHSLDIGIVIEDRKLKILLRNKTRMSWMWKIRNLTWSVVAPGVRKPGVD